MALPFLSLRFSSIVPAPSSLFLDFGNRIRFGGRGLEEE
jgi:hypothetical protein